MPVRACGRALMRSRAVMMSAGCLGPEYSSPGRIGTGDGSSTAAANGSNYIASDCPRSPSIDSPTCADDRY